MINKVSIFAFFALQFVLNAAWAESDKELAEKAAMAREAQRHGGMDHPSQDNADPAAGKYRGVFYGYLPCPEPDCNGIKMTLSLNVKNRYLLVIQPAKLLNRESFEKGKYEWDDATGILVLTPNKEAPERRLAIKDVGSLLYLNGDGKSMPGDQDRYLLQRSDKAGNRDVHIH